MLPCASRLCEQSEDTMFWKDEVSGISRSPPRGSVRLVTFQTGCLELVSRGQRHGKLKGRRVQS